LRAALAALVLLAPVVARAGDGLVARAQSSGRQIYRA
jgi:hypothetical protein